MNAFDMTHIVGPLHKLMEKNNTGDEEISFQSVGIGDGGNEVGMGKMFDLIQTSTVKHKEKVACVVKADHLIVCGGTLVLLYSAPVYIFYLSI
jgi:D-glutamate cyclase